MYVTVYKVGKDKENILKQWGESIQKENIEEALLSLREENCEAESLTMFRIGEEYFVVGVMLAEQGKEIVPHNPGRDINKKHVKILRECLDGQIQLEKVYDLRI
jgi:hypothetical protein